jgi:Na+/H+ antiporter NhaD/arsenite permease-like protein
VVCAASSWRLTPPGLHEKNRFTFEPIEEIVVIFFAIFATISPALELLARHSARLALTTPRGFFWASGGFSAILDNAPTYLAAVTAARALPVPGGVAVIAGVREDVLRAISLGAVSFGALTSIGNGPNLLVRSIAVSRGVAMPGFFRYTAIASAVLLPTFVAVAFLFL